MNTHADKTSDNKNRAVSKSLPRPPGKTHVNHQFIDNRPESIAQRKMQLMATEAQRERSGSLVNRVSQQQAMEDEELLQGKFNNVAPTVNPIQCRSVAGVTNFGNFSDLGNGKFGTTQPTDATEVAGLVNEIRSKAAAAGIHQNIKVLTGTHGDQSGHLIGEAMFYSEDLAHEGHKLVEGGWINVMNVKGKSKDTIAGWMNPGSSVIILAWCYSKTSDQNWANVHCYKNETDYQNDIKVW